MQVTFLGSSHGLPEPNRKCSCLLLRVAENCYFVDMGMPAMDALTRLGIPPQQVKGVFITHMHGDHTDGLISFVDLLSWYYKTANPSIFLPNMEAVPALAGWISATGVTMRPEIPFFPVQEGVLYDDGCIQVSAIRTRHTESSYAFHIQAEGKNLLITGDLASPATDFPAIAFSQHMDLIVCEGAHFPVTDYLPCFQKCSAGQYCITHYANWNFPHMLTLKDALPDAHIRFATDDLTLCL